MKKKIILLFMLVTVLCLSFVICYADSKTIQLGNTGITCQVDSKYDVITSSNKKDYSQQIQSLITADNVVLIYSAEDGYFVLYYDQGKDFEKYDFTNKKAEDIQANYKDYIGADLSSIGYGKDYDVSVYDSGKAKWLKLDLSEDNYIFYCTIQGNRSVSLFAYPQAIKNGAEIEATIDSFDFGKPSFWDWIKSAAGKISDFGRSILGTPGVIIIWILVGPSIVGLLGYIIILIVGVIASIFKKKR